MNWKFAQTLADTNKIEHEYGVRYTDLLELPYFDTACCSVINPIHNILLGTPKRMISEAMQTQCDRFAVPSDVGQIPHKISGFASFTADQWRIKF